MSNAPARILSAAVSRLLLPLVRILLRYGLPYAAFADLAKRAYIDVADADFRIEGRKQTVSRISVITGLSRKEVSRVRDLGEPVDDASQRYNRAARVIGGWVRDPDFHDKGAKPAALPFEGDSEPSFSELARRYSGDVPARAVLDELTRVGSVEMSATGRVRLKTRAYVPTGGETDKLSILGSDVAELISTIDHNLECEPEDAYFQRKVSYDNLPSEAAPELRELAADRAQAMLEQLDVWMATRDRDTNPSVKGSGRKKVSLGIYYYEEDLSEDDE